MKRAKVILSVATVFLATAVCVTSCKKKDTTPKDEDTSTASDNNLVESTSSDVDRIAASSSDIAVGDSLNAFRLGDESVLTYCASVERDSVNKKIKITFNGQTCADGHTRSGALIFDYSGSAPGANFYRNPGFKCVITDSNYVVNGNRVSINKTITNTTNFSVNPNLTWSISANVSIVKSGGGTIAWNANRVKTLLNTSDTSVYHGQAIPITWSKARIGITGSATGTTAQGESFTANITSQLVIDWNCSPNPTYPNFHPIIQGKLEFTPGSKATRYIDYGNGTCDATFTVTINGVTFTINP
jgi:hypothetical protein